jgi:hypothetical protein
MKRAGGRSVQGYNVQVVASSEQVIVAADITQQSNDSGQLAPMVASAREALREAGVADPIGTVLADGGYWNSLQISEVREKGIDVLVPIENRSRTAPRKALSPTRPRGTANRGRALETRGAGALPATTTDRRAGVREHQVHPPGRPLPAPGLVACQAELQLIAATHNLLKLWRAGLAGAGDRPGTPLPA